MTTPNDSPQFKSTDESWEYIQGQKPLPNVAANTDFNQGVERGKYIERTRIIKLLEQDPDSHHYALRAIKGENK